MRNGKLQQKMSPDDVADYLNNQIDIMLGTRDSDGNLYEDIHNGSKVQLRLSELYPFPNHPFRIVKDDDYAELMEGISQIGVTTPILVTKREDGDGYYIISGHRRTEACRDLNMRTIPAIIVDADMDTATIMMVRSNNQRTVIYPMDKAKAYKMMNDAMKHQGKQLIPTVGISAEHEPKELIPTVGISDKLTVQSIAEQFGASKSSVFNYIKLCDLIPKFQNEVDSGRLGIRSGLQIANLTSEQQNDVVFALNLLHMLDDRYTGAFFNEDKAKEIRELSGTLDWSVEKVRDIISPPKIQKPKPKAWKPDVRSISREFPPDVPVEDYDKIIRDLIHKHYYSPRQLEETELSLDEQIARADWLKERKYPLD